MGLSSSVIAGRPRTTAFHYFTLKALLRNQFSSNANFLLYRCPRCWLIFTIVLSLMFRAGPEKKARRKTPAFSPILQTFGALWSVDRHRTLASTMTHGTVLEFGSLRRSAIRYKLKLPVLFHWNDGAEHMEGGFTCDVALDGALILSSKCPPVGAEVRIEVLIPAPDRSGEEIRIECVGRVTRVVDQPGCTAFGVHGTFDDEHLTRQALM